LNIASTARGSGFPATKGSRSKADIIQSRLESRSHKDNTKLLNPWPRPGMSRCGDGRI